MIVGTEEELHIASGNRDTLAALRKVCELSDATIVLKRGALGASVYTGATPADLDGGINGQGGCIEVLNVLGAGDAFMSGLLLGFVRKEPREQWLRYANACGAMVVSRHGCAPAMPSTEACHPLKNWISTWPENRIFSALTWMNTLIIYIGLPAGMFNGPSLIYWHLTTVAGVE